MSAAEHNNEHAALEQGSQDFSERALIGFEVGRRLEIAEIPGVTQHIIEPGAAWVRGQHVERLPERVGTSGCAGSAAVPPHSYVGTA